MSTATANKPPAAGTPRRDAAAARTSAAASPAAASTRSPARAATPTRAARSPATPPVSARAAVKKPAPPSALRRNSSQVDSATDDAAAAAAAAARDEQAALLADLTDRLRAAETDAEERQRQVDVLNARLDEAVAEQAKLEERAHEEEEKAEALENAKRELTRQHRELEAIYEAERAQAMRDKEATQAREDELHDTIQRLKETREKTKDDDEPLVSPSFRNSNLDAAASFAPPNSVTRSNSRSNSKLIHQKDKIIEDLRLELAEYQVKLLEVENAGGGRMHELEKQLLETRMTNARLMEDNESFQLLLGEKTLNGDLARGDFLRESSHADDRAPSRQGPSTSLADELESAEEADVEVVRRLEAEVNSMKDQNKALTLYINKIIGRLLTYQGFESVLGNDTEGEHGGADTNKELPPPPPPKDAAATDAPLGFLSRAKSVMGNAPRKQRPMSIAGPSPSVNEDPATAPRIPLARAQSTRAPSGSNPHRRSTSTIPDTNAANIVNTMYRMPPPAATPGQTSPGLVSPRNSFFGIPIATPSTGSTASTPTSRTVSGTTQIPEDREPDARSDAASHVDTPSPPRGRERPDAPPMTMTGKGMRPLRLVQNEEEAVKARKAANRASWFGGLFGQTQPAQNQAQE